MKVLVYGSSELGQVVKNLVKVCGHDFEGFIDDYKEGDLVIGTYEYIKTQSQYKWHGIAIAIGYKDLAKRWDIYQKLNIDGYKIISLIHPQALISPTSNIGRGSIIMMGAIVDCFTEIKELSVLWNGSVVSHNSIIGENSFISPNATICGCTEIGRNTFIGAGSIITDHKKVPERSFIKAGSVINIQQNAIIDIKSGSI